MKVFKKIAGVSAAVMLAVTLSAGTADARDLSVTWAFLFPVPLPLPVWTVDHPHSFITIAFLFPVWLPLPVYDYGDRGPIQPRLRSEIPSDSVVYLDGQEKGKTLDYARVTSGPSMADGTHTFELRHDGRTVYLARFEEVGS